MELHIGLRKSKILNYDSLTVGALKLWLVLVVLTDEWILLITNIAILLNCVSSCFRMER